MKRRARTILAIAALLGALSIALPIVKGGGVTAQTPDVVMEVTFGFDGYCRPDGEVGWCPLRVVLSNEGPDVEGELQVSVRGDMEFDLYARPVLLPSHSRKAFTLYLPSGDLYYRARPTVQLVAGGEVVALEEAAAAWLDPADRLYGLASSSPSALNLLNDVAPVGGNAAVAHLDLDALPPDPLGWEGLDVLILNDVDTTQLSGRQRRALEIWVSHGGHLVVGGGVGAARTVAGLPDAGQNLLPVTLEGSRTVDDLWALGRRVNATPAPGPYAISEVALQHGETLIQQDDLILVASRPVGGGRVDFLAFDAGLRPFTRWEENALLWESIIGAGSAQTQQLTVRDQYDLREAVNSIPGLELPSALQILVFLLLYTVLIGPLNYLVLRKLDRRELAWFTIPALVLGFTLFAYVTGFQIRGRQAIVHRLAAVYVPPGTSVGHVSQAVGLFSPRRTHYDARISTVGVRRISGGPVGEPFRIVGATESSTLEDLRVDVGGIKPFLAEGYVDVSGAESDLRLVVDAAGALRLEGSVRVGDRPLGNAVLIAGDVEQRLGDLEAGQEAAIHLPLQGAIAVAPSPAPAPFPVPSSSGAQLPERILGPGSYWENRNLYRRYQFLQALFPYNEPGLSSGVYLMGWVEEESPLPVEVVGRPFRTLGTAFYVYRLPDVSLGEESVISIPAALTTRQVEETDGYVNVWDDQIQIGPESSAVFRFTVWPEVTLRQVDRLELHLSQNTETGVNSPPQYVNLWDWEAASWESQDVNWELNVIPHPGRYVRSDGTVLVQLENGSTVEYTDLRALTITIEGRR